MKSGLVEYALITGFLVLAAVGAIAIFGDEIRSALGVRPPGPPAASAAPRASAR